MNKILLIGATGMLGQPVLKEFVKAGFEVTAMVRDISKARSVLPENIPLIKGDLRRIETLFNAIEGQEGIYMNLSEGKGEREKDFHAETDGLKNVISVSKKMDIKRIAIISSMVQNYDNFNWWCFNIKNEAVNMVRNSGLNYFIFSPSNFMESMSQLYKRGKFIFLLGDSKQKMFWIAGKDYGKQVAKAFRLNPNRNVEYIVQGLEGLTIDESAKIFKFNYRTNLKILRIPLNLIRFFGLFSADMNYVWHISKALNNYPEKFAAEETWKELGKPETTLKEFAQKVD